MTVTKGRISDFTDQDLKNEIERRKMSDHNGNGVTNEYRFNLGNPAFLTIEASDKSAEARLDLFVAYRFIVNVADKKPTDDARYAVIVEYLAKALEVDKSKISELSAYKFREAVMKLVTAEVDDLKKTLATIASSPPRIPESQATSPDGQGNSKTLGLQTSTP